MKPLNVGLIGCGDFARGMHVPNLNRNPKYRIVAAMDINEDQAKKMAEDTGASYWTTERDRVMSDPSVDVIFITTRHDSHAEISIQAANAGKHILCEKPMGLNIEQCRAVAEAVKRSGVKYTIGYNRGMAPLVVKARALLKELSGKKMIYHRIQAPFPESHWTHDPDIGGGRFVGEGCHIFDLICELVPAEPVEVYASGGTFLDPSVVKIPDSAIVTISFADGSVGTCLIASAGCPVFPKEATEIYCQNKAIYIADFKEMQYYGFEGQPRIDVVLSEADKGQRAEIDELADAILNGGESPNGISKAARAALISYKVNDSVRTGLPIPITRSEYMF